MTCLDVLFSYCSYGQDDHIRQYAEYAKTLIESNSLIPDVFLKQSQHLYATKQYDRAGKLIEAAFLNFYGSEDAAEMSDTEKSFVKLHQDSCLAYYIHSSKETIQVHEMNSWMDRYDVPDSPLLVCLLALLLCVYYAL